MVKITKKEWKNGGESWEVFYRDSNGKRRKPRFQNEKTAILFAKTIELKKERVKHGLEVGLEPNLPLQQMTTKYFSQMTNHKDSETIRREKSVYKALTIFLGDIPIRKINKLQLTNYLEYRQKECGVSPATAETEFRTLRAFFNTLISYNYLEVNPIKGVNPPRVPDKEIIILTDKQVVKLLNVVDSPNYRDLIEFYLHTGARRGEVLPKRPFTWDQVDFRNREATVIGKKRVPRIVPLDNVAFQILRRRKFIEKHEFPFKFDYHYLYKKYLKYLEAAEIEATGLHSLRRTYGSRLLESGVDIVEVSKLLGHRDLRVTMNHYISVSNKKLHSAAKALDDVWT